MVGLSSVVAKTVDERLLARGKVWARLNINAAVDVQLLSYQATPSSVG